MKLYTLSAIEIRKKFIEGVLSAEEIANYFLARIDKYDPKIGAFLAVYHDRVRQQAKLLDQKRKEKKPLGRLAAVPIALKDNIHVKGELTTCGSKFLENYRPPFHATVTELFEAEDALIMGKTNMDEFAMGSSNENSAFQETSNPWCLDCVPGGSSGGSAAACAARLVPLSLGSDTGGSVRQPAAFCGVFGLKPTYGRVSRYGLVAFGSSLDQISPFATTATDIGMIMEVMGCHDPHDATSLTFPAEEYLDHLDTSIKGKKIGVPWRFLEDLNGETRDNFLLSIETLKTLGCEIVDINLDSLKYAVATYYIIATAEASTNLARFDGIRYGVRSKQATTLDEVYDFSRTEGFGAEVKKRILLGTYVLSAGYQDAFYKKAKGVRLKITDEFHRAFSQCDLIAMPTAPSAAFLKGAIQDPIAMYLQDIYTIGVNLSGVTAISIPSGFNKKRQPYGLQIIGPKNKDLLVCNLASVFEKKSPFAKEIPPEFDRE
jgi:aspartyl-tRNA(Asn)/glutamyl-tRNA(Gln) amidotransferase subunit A